MDAEKKKALLKLNTTIKPKFGTKWATASSSDESGHEDDLDPEQLAQIIPDTKSDDEDSVISSVLIGIVFKIKLSPIKTRLRYDFFYLRTPDSVITSFTY